MTDSPSLNRVPGRRLSAFAAVGIATGGVNVPLQSFLPAFYVAATGMSLQAVGLIFMISRLWSAASDPVVGWLSDRTHGRWGRRKPWIIGGGLVFLSGLVAIFFPPAGAGQFYLGFWLLFLCLGWTATATPLYAWGGEMSAIPVERSRIQAYIQTGAGLGVFLVLLLPALFDTLDYGDIATRVPTMGALIAVALTIGLLLIARLFHEPPVEARRRPAGQGRRALIDLARDGILWRIILSDLFVTLGQGCRGAVFLFFVTHYLGFKAVSAMLLLQYAAGVFAAPLWARISYRFGRINTLIMAESIQVLINLTLLLVAPGQLWLFIALLLAQGLTQGSGNLMLRAMIYDVADRQRAKTGTESAGLLSSIFNITTNAAFALAIGIAFTAVGWFGFDPGHANDRQAIQGLHLFFACGPALGHLLSIIIIWPARAKSAGDLPP